jgi:hypothetical protein
MKVLARGNGLSPAQIRFSKTVLPESAESVPKRVYGSIRKKSRPPHERKGRPGQRVKGQRSLHVLLPEPGNAEQT